MTAELEDPTPYRRSSDNLSNFEEESTPELADLCRNEIEPALSRYFALKLHSSMRPGDNNRLNQDALELVSEAKVRIVKRLCQGRGGSQIDDIEAYTRAVARNVFHQYLRNKYPRRLSIKNQCRYLFTHHRDLKIWKNEVGAWTCGLASSDRSVKKAEAAQLTDEGYEALRAKINKKRNHGDPKELIEAVFVILEHFGRTLTLDELISHVVEVLRVKEPVEGSEPDEMSSIAGASHSAQNVIEEKEFVEMIWKEVLQLPVRHRAALLLNFRDGNGDDLTGSIAAFGVASIRQIAHALDIDAEHFAEIWKELPWDDKRIAAHLGIERQQVINLRQSAKQMLRRKLS